MRRRSFQFFASTLWCLSIFSAASAFGQAPHPGAVIYQKQCASCHGDKGQGVKDEYDEPLHGNRSIESLAQRIERTMPEDDVGACVGEDAKNVAAYIYDAFYSPAAQWRLKPPEFDLTRLTIPQYRNSVTDLIGRFRPGFDKPVGAEHGLKARYSGRRIPVFGPQLPPDPDENKQAAKERLSYEQKDGVVAYKFGEQSPDPSQLKPHEFTIRWDGSLIAPETGVYEFIVRTENGVRLWVNDSREMLIDSWVSSGADVREEKKSLFLLGGRAYPISVEFFKYKEKTASIELLWKPPFGVQKTIPLENFSPLRVRDLYVVKTSFPPDDRSEGYERGSTISKEWDEATTESAIDVAEYVDDHLDELAGTKAGQPDRDAKLKSFAQRFLEGAFRRPLTAEEMAQYLERPFSKAPTPAAAVKRVVLFSLKSPQFLYPEIGVEAVPTDYQVAARLALNLWDSLPDQKLLQAAAAGKLRTRQDLAAQATRMITDARAKAKMNGFFHHWLELERAEAISKDPKAFPGFDAAVLADLRESLELFLNNVVWGEKGDYRELLYADYLYLNERLGKLYGKPVKGDGFQKVGFNPTERAGVVTHPYLLSAFSYARHTSPIHRGVFLTRTIVGMTLKNPQVAVAFEDAKFEQHLTMREKITELTKNANCMGCHATINPLGFSLENYDAIGRWRTKEDNKPINPESDFNTDEGKTIHLTGPRDLVKYAAESSGGHRAFIHQLFQFTAKQAVEVYGPDALEELRQSFISSNFHIRKLLAQMASMAAARGLPNSTPQVSAPPTAPGPTGWAQASLPTPQKP